MRNSGLWIPVRNSSPKVNSDSVRNSSPKVTSDWRLGIELRIGLGLTTPDSGLESGIMHNSGLRTPVRNSSPKVNSDSVRNSSPKVNSDWRLGIELRIGLGLTTPDSGLESEICSHLRTPDSSPKFSVRNKISDSVRSGRRAPPPCLQPCEFPHEFPHEGNLRNLAFRGFPHEES